MKTPLTDEWVEEHLADLTWLAIHLIPGDEGGNKTWSTNIVDELVREMLSDIFEVREDAHKHDPCTVCIDSKIRDDICEELETIPKDSSDNIIPGGE